MRSRLIMLGIVLVAMTVMLHAAPVNTISGEDSVFVSPDGQYLYLNCNRYNIFPLIFGGGEPYIPQGSTCYPGHVNGATWDVDFNVYRFERQLTGGYDNPQQLFVGCCVMTHDGIVFYGQIQAPGSTNIYDRDLAVWELGGTPKQYWVDGPCNTSVPQDNPHRRAGSTEAIYVAETNGTKDLWRTTIWKQGQKYRCTAPTLLASVNTSANEDHPWLTADGLTLFFTRDLQFRLASRPTLTSPFGPDIAISLGQDPAAAVGELSCAVIPTSGAFECFFTQADIPAEQIVVMRSVSVDGGQTFSAAQPVD